jgi:hypothetical protein
MVDEALIAMLNQAGRLPFGKLRSLAAEVPAPVFTSMFLFPVLVGFELYRGTLGAGTGDGATIQFKLSDIADSDAEERPDPSGLRHAIYPLVHKPGTRSRLDTFSIGRDGHNDMVLADYAISRRHATITVERGRLLLKDLESSNGTELNGKALAPKRFEPFGAGDEVTFGRFKFAVVSPGVLYVNLRAEGAGLG